MDDFFLNTSGFLILEHDPPECFLDVQRHLAPRVANLFHPEFDLVVGLAANLCRRLADTMLHAGEIVKTVDTQQLAGHLFISWHLIGFYASCKALLDAAAIALTKLYDLRAVSGAPLAPKQQDFNKGAIWIALETQHPAVHSRYQELRTTMNEIVLWRDASLHRVTLIVMTSLARNVDTNVHHFIGYTMVLAPDPDFRTMIENPQTYGSERPTYHYDRWRGDLLRLCQEVCADIIATS
jgi:hypothetical protein